MRSPCEHCPWRIANQGKRTPWGFYRVANLRRLWNQLRRGGAQSCHPTDPSHPDHVAAGAKLGATPQECPGSVILIRREIARMADAAGVVNDEGVKRYLRERPKGLTKIGILYWCVQRISFANTRVFNEDGPLPEVNDNDPAVGLPRELA